MMDKYGNCYCTKSDQFLDISYITGNYVIIVTYSNNVKCINGMYCFQQNYCVYKYKAEDYVVLEIDSFLFSHNK